MVSPTVPPGVGLTGALLLRWVAAAPLFRTLNRTDETMSDDNQVEEPLDAEDWEIALEAYAAYPDAAFGLARHLMAVRGFLQSHPPDVLRAIAALNQAAEALYPHTEFHKSSYELYRIAIEGRVTSAHEALMESLGVKF